MKHLVFNSEIAAQLRNNQVFADGVIEGKFATGTQSYAELRKHPHNNLFALIVDDRFQSLFTTEEKAAAVVLDNSWNPDQAASIVTIISQPISQHPTDATVNRVAHMAMPKHTAATEFITYVVIKHFRGLDYINTEIPDKVFELKATNNRKIQTPQGEVNEFDYFYLAVSSGVGLFDLMRNQILVEDSIARFNFY